MIRTVHIKTRSAESICKPETLNHFSPYLRVCLLFGIFPISNNQIIKNQKKKKKDYNSDSIHYSAIDPEDSKLYTTLTHRFSPEKERSWLASISPISSATSKASLNVSAHFIGTQNNYDNIESLIVGTLYDPSTKQFLVCEVDPSYGSSFSSSKVSLTANVSIYSIDPSTGLTRQSLAFFQLRNVPQSGIRIFAFTRDPDANFVYALFQAGGTDASFKGTLYIVQASIPNTSQPSPKPPSSKLSSFPFSLQIEFGCMTFARSEKDRSLPIFVGTTTNFSSQDGGTKISELNGITGA